MSLVADHLVPVHSEQLEPGMYVAELDRSWLHTPFEERGFLITQATQIDTLRRTCEYVYIDPQRSEAIALLDLQAANAEPIDDPEQASGEDLLQLNGCRQMLDEATSQIASIVLAARRDGRLEITPIFYELDALVDHVLKWSDAIQWLLATEHAHGYLYRRSVGTAVFSILFGRRLGLDHEALRELALGSLVLDIGKTRVPITILSKPERLNSAERSFARRHVDQGVNMIRFEGRMEQRIVDMVAGHHERLDGSGYPHHIGGTEIPLFARIAGIADTYDAMTQNRGYANARSGHAALRFLNTWRDAKFDASLVDEFVHTLGVYPIGTNVELTDGTTGIVCQQNPSEPKRPNVLLSQDHEGRSLKTVRIVESSPDRRIRRALPASVALL